MADTYRVPKYNKATGAGTLSGAARDLGVSLDTIVKANPRYTANPNLVQEGAMLNTRYVEPTPTTPTTPQPTTTAPTVPIVPTTPTQTPTVTPTTPIKTKTPAELASESYYSGLQREFTPFDESNIRESKRQQAQGLIDSINSMIETKRNTQVEENKQSTGRTRSLVASRGLIGSGRGGTMQEKTEEFNKKQLNEIENERMAKISAILSDVESKASDLIEKRREEAAGNQKAYIDYLEKGVENSRAKIKDLAGLGVTQDQLDPADISDLLEQTGYSKLQLDSIWNANLPDSMKTQWQTVTRPDANGMATVTKVGYNPITKKTEKQEYTLDVPYDTIAEKELKEIDGVLYSVDTKTGTAKALTAPSESKMLDIQNKRLQNQKLIDERAGTSTSKDKEEKKKEIITLAKELRGDATGKKQAVGASIQKLVPFGKTAGLEPKRAAYDARVETLKANLTLDNLKLLKGAMSDKDLAFLQAIGSSLDTSMSEKEFNKELDRIVEKLENSESQKQDEVTTKAPDGTEVIITD